ncbi:isoprenoid biosynthesis glyoxalase ElbB [Aestuariirhabdus sp. Z084]|uniref:isoprenoid biosynthesis glyoxalase ElbB n=1 Tax=Aestuariirhabdus haliotis TaxID=2918751 RepID=UPI00201B3689|nr:isoprenoid biosynthesis glyoxalase ElbB [Aestuariirhabdus haliotis]MCL6414353.1 isoprenoid biosynthesis glyoxalase ElbB [Aestuariirhabdus haliotis]MCL6418285.1 isoprenoid biosynthesis glyoxalase ElbB [Aestuariirhabdus haliotis]
MGKRVAVILSGCGVFDGSEIYESVITLLRLDSSGSSYQCFAPDIPQYHVINHLTGEEMPEQRNVLIEAARLARGDIKALRDLDADLFDALIVPGGFGAAKNLSDFAVKGSELNVLPELQRVVTDFHESSKPVGLVCIAPAMAGKLFAKGVTCTIGDDADTASAIEATGAVHQDCGVDGIIVDETFRLVTTPAYMLAGRLTEAASGINQLVDKVLEMA